MTSEVGFSWEAPTEHGQHWIELELDHPVNPWEHEGAGSITWGANLDRLAPLGEQKACRMDRLPMQTRFGPPAPKPRRAARELDPRRTECRRSARGLRPVASMNAIVAAGAQELSRTLRRLGRRRKAGAR